MKDSKQAEPRGWNTELLQTDTLVFFWLRTSVAGDQVDAKSVQRSGCPEEHERAVSLQTPSILGAGILDKRCVQAD